MEGLDKEWLDCVFITSSWIIGGLDKEWLDFYIYHIFFE